jgi:hypothetical protein
VTKTRHFPPPWSVEDLAAAFVIRDKTRQALAYVSYEDKPGRRTAAGSRVQTCYDFTPLYV